MTQVIVGIARLVGYSTNFACEMIMIDNCWIFSGERCVADVAACRILPHLLYLTCVRKWDCLLADFEEQSGVCVLYLD